MSKLYTADGKRRSSMAHAKHPRFCICGKVMHGNGAAMHFYIDGSRDAGYREGHKRLSQRQFEEMYPDWRERL